MLNKLIAIAILAVLPVSGATSARAADDDRIHLRLFAKGEIDRSKGCSVTLWQANKDPEKDKFAHVFFEKISGKNYRKRTAQIKIGKSIVRLSRLATGGKTNGYGLYSYQLYQMRGQEGFAVLRLKLEPEEGEAVEVSGGSMTVILPGKKPFKVKVRGGAGCFTPPAPARAATASAPGNNSLDGIFRKYKVRFARIPRSVIRRVHKKYKCDLSVMKTGVTGFQMSEESAIWEFPCERFAYSASAVYALVYLTDPSQNFSFLAFQTVKGRKRSASPGVLLNPQWNVRRRTVTSISLGRSLGDCGTLERHKVNDAGEFKLVEYREKKRCDGKVVRPERFPLIYRAR